MARTKIDPRDFVVCWMNSTSREEVAKSMNLTVSQIDSKAIALRKKGVRLPKKALRKDMDDLDVAQLNSLINKYTKEKQRL